MGLAFGFEFPALLSRGACACVSAAVGVHTQLAALLSLSSPLHPHAMPACCLVGPGLSPTLMTQVTLHRERPRVSAFSPEEFTHEAGSREIIRTLATKLQGTSWAERLVLLGPTGCGNALDRPALPCMVNSFLSHVRTLTQTWDGQRLPGVWVPHSTPKMI